MRQISRCPQAHPARPDAVHSRLLGFEPCSSLLPPASMIYLYIHICLCEPVRSLFNVDSRSVALTVTLYFWVTIKWVFFSQVRLQIFVASFFTCMEHQHNYTLQYAFQLIPSCDWREVERSFYTLLSGKNMVRNVLRWIHISSWLISVCISANPYNIAIVQVNTPSSTHEMEKCYGQLDKIIIVLVNDIRWMKF